VLPPDPDAATEGPKAIRQVSDEEIMLKVKKWTFDVAHYDWLQKTKPARKGRPS
jgi:hypothetical protein